MSLIKSIDQFFYLTVWNDNSGFPGDTIYSRLVLTQYSDTLNKFTQYLLEKPQEDQHYILHRNGSNH